MATGAVPLGALPPGDYVVRGVVRLEDGTTRTRHADPAEGAALSVHFAGTALRSVLIARVGGWSSSAMMARTV